MREGVMATEHTYRSKDANEVRLQMMGCSCGL